MALFSNNDSSLQILVTARDDASAVFQQVERNMLGSAASMKKVGQSMSTFVTLPIVAAGAAVLKTASDFESSMNAIKALVQPTADEFQALQDRARELGATTVFSAQEAANAIEVLAKNGLSVTQILDGAVDSSLALAAATGTDLSNAADIATDVMLSFNKEAKDLAGLVDGIAGVTAASKFDIDDYRLALAQAGGVAGGLGVEFEDFNAAIASTSHLFASGSDAGTSFKVFLQRLNPVSEKAADEIKALGLEFFDAEGNMKSMADISQELQNAFEGMSEAQKANSLSTIFGTDAMRTAIGLAEGGSERFNELAAAIANVSAQDMADARMQGLAGAMEELKGALEELALAIAESGLLDAFTNFVKLLTAVVREIGKADPFILNLGVAFLGVLAAIGPVLFLMGSLGTTAAALGVTVGALAGTIGIVGLALTAIIGSLMYIVGNWQMHWDNIKWAVDMAAAGINAALNALFGFITGIFTSVGTFVAGIWNNIAIAGTTAFNSLKSGFSAMGNFVISIAETVANMWIKAVNTIIGALNKIQVSIPKWVPGIGGKSFGINLPLVSEIQLPRFEFGGLVPGARGTEVPIIAHGGEYVMPAGRAAGMGGNTYTFIMENVQVRNDEDIRRINKIIERKFRGLTINNKYSR